MTEFDDRRKLWTDALRSGNYPQSSRALRNEKGFCCLGVLCDLYMKETGKGEWNLVYSNDVVEDWFFRETLPEGISENSAVTLKTVQEWIGLSSPTGDFGLDCLAQKNDKGSTFDEIADLIESESSRLFV